MGIVGFGKSLINPFGPDQKYSTVAPGSDKVELRFMGSPIHPLVAEIVASTPGSSTKLIEQDLEQPLNVVTVTE